MYKVIMFPLTLAKESRWPHLTSLMHHLNTPRTRMHSPDQCNKSYLFTSPPPPPPTNLLPIRIMGYCNKMCQWVLRTHKMCLHKEHICSIICMTMGLYACQYCTSMHLQWYSKWFWSTQHNTHHCMNGEAIILACMYTCTWRSKSLIVQE